MLSCQFSRLDELNTPSREFYENARLKLSYSLFIAAWGMMFLGMTSEYGAHSRAAFLGKQLVQSFPQTDDSKIQAESLQDIVGSFGFSCFLCVLAFIYAIISAIYLSPWLSSPNEAKILTIPQNIEFVSSNTPIHSREKANSVSNRYVSMILYYFTI